MFRDHWVKRVFLNTDFQRRSIFMLIALPPVSNKTSTKPFPWIQGWLSSVHMWNRYKIEIARVVSTSFDVIKAPAWVFYDPSFRRWFDETQLSALINFPDMCNISILVGALFFKMISSICQWASVFFILHNINKPICSDQSKEKPFSDLYKICVLY